MKNVLGFAASCLGGAGVGGVLWTLHEEGYRLKVKKPGFPVEITQENDSTESGKGNVPSNAEHQQVKDEAVNPNSSGANDVVTTG